MADSAPAPLEDFLRTVTTVWLKQFERARKDKREKFSKVANRIWEYYGKNYLDLYWGTIRENEQKRKPHYPTRINKTGQFVSLMVPWMHHKVPNRLVAPLRSPPPPEITQLFQQAVGQPLPMNLPAPNHVPDTAGAWLMQTFLNYICADHQNNLSRESRTMLPQALAMGRGVVWHEMIDSPTGEVPYTSYDSNKNLFISPDCQRMHEADVIYRVRKMPVWRIAERFHRKEDELRDKWQDYWGQRRKGSSETDLLLGPSDETDSEMGAYIEVFSRCGIGHHFHAENDELRDFSAAFGDKQYVYLALMPGLDTPLNFPATLTAQQAKDALEWPIRFWAERQNPWPCTVLDFIPNQDDPWATSVLQKALPIQEGLDHGYSFLMDHIEMSSRDITVCSQAMAQGLKQAIIEGVDQSVVTVPGDVAEEVRKMFEVIQFPRVNRDAWDVIGAMERLFEDLTGMTPLIMGQQGGRQLRSAQEAAALEGHASTRPEDMRECYDKFQSAVALKEGQAARLKVPSKVVAPLFGEQVQDDAEMGEVPSGPFSMLWDELIYRPDDPVGAAADFVYSIEAGTGQRKNRQKLESDTRAMMEIAFGPLLNAWSSGAPVQDQLNSLVAAAAEGFDNPELRKIVFPALMPPPPPPGQAPPEGAPPP